MLKLSGSSRAFIVLLLVVIGVIAVGLLTLVGGREGGRPAAALAATPKPEARPVPAPTVPPRPTIVPRDNQWVALSDGLDIGTFVAPRVGNVGDGRIRILRIDPAKFRFLLLNASAPGGQKQALSAKQWCVQNHCVAAINASMYRRDNRTSVSYMKSPTYVNNPSASADKAAVVFDPTARATPAIQIADLEQQRLADLRRNYGTVVQSVRMLSADGRNVWKPSAKQYSTAAIGQDSAGRILFIHVRTPYSTHDLTNILLGLPIQLKRAMYVEGGPEAQLYVACPPQEFEFLGSFETGFRENDGNVAAWPVPNVLAIAKK